MIKKRTSQPNVRQWCYQDGGSLTQHYEFILYSWFFLLLYEFGSAYCSEFICICIIPCLCPLPVFPIWESVLSVYISQSQVSVYFLSVSFLFSYLSLCVSRSLTLCVLVISLAMFLSLCFILCLPKSVFHVCFHVCLSSFQHQAHVFLSLFKTFESCKGLAFLPSGLSKVPVLCFVPKS